MTAENRETLLFDSFDDLSYERDLRDILAVDNEGTVTEYGVEWCLTGSARGVPLGRVDARDRKVVTYSEMNLSETADGWHAYVVFDV